MITREKLNNMAELAMLSLDQEEVGNFQMEISHVLSFVSKIKDIDTENIEPTVQLELETHPLREDIVGTSLDVEDVVKNTLEEQYGYFKILNIMD